MNFIEIKEIENDKPIHYVIKSLGIYSLSQIEDVIIKQIISESIDKFVPHKDTEDSSYWFISLDMIRMQFISHVYPDIHEMPRFIRLYKEIMLEKGFTEKRVIDSMEYSRPVNKIKTEHIVNQIAIYKEVKINTMDDL